MFGLFGCNEVCVRFSSLLVFFCSRDDEILE